VERSIRSWRIRYLLPLRLFCSQSQRERRKGGSERGHYPTPLASHHNDYDAAALPTGWPGGMDTAAMSRCYWRMAQLGAIIMEP
jgi:hypothetical protein